MITIQQTLKRYFGFDDFRHGQAKVVTSIVNGRSAAAIFPTGSGKSLCYQLPALHLPHLTLVVSPLLALIQDQLNFLHSKKVPAASIGVPRVPDSSGDAIHYCSSGDAIHYY